MDLQIGPLDDTTIAQAAQIWNEGWHTAHAQIVPKELTKLRTLESFLDRLRDHMDHTRVAMMPGEMRGFHMIKDDEVYQFYVASNAHGQGVAQSLMADAEARLLAAGQRKVWLACTVDNDRAARFYEKSGWSNSGTRVIDLDTSEGPFPLPVWRFEKTLS